MCVRVCVKEFVAEPITWAAEWRPRAVVGQDAEYGGGTVVVLFRRSSGSREEPGVKSAAAAAVGDEGGKWGKKGESIE